MLVHTSYSCYHKSNRPIRKGFTAKDRYDKALEDEKKNFENAGYRKPKKALPKTITRYVR